MLDFLPTDKPIAESINSLMGYLSENDRPVVTQWHHIFLRPIPHLVHHHLFYYNDEQDAFICFLVYQGATFLPDWVSKNLQLYGGYHLAENMADLIWLQVIIYRLLGMFTRLCQWRMFLSMWLIFNPYTFPWIILVNLTEWFLEGFSGILPVIGGMDLGGVLALSGIGIVSRYIKNLVLTMPYLPSEGIKEIVGNYPVYRFSGFPRLWSEYGIPNELREQWYDQQPEIIEHFLKYYGNIEQDIVPSRIVEEYYNEYIKDATITTSLTSFDHFLTTGISSLNHLLDTNIIMNQMITTYEKLIHNF